MFRSLLWSRLAIVFSLLALLTLGLSAPSATQNAPKPIRALLIMSGGYHDYVKQKDIIPKGISARANVQWKVAYDKETANNHLNRVYENPNWAKDFDVVVHDECCADIKDVAVINRILEPHRQGVPGVVLHCGMHCFRSEGWDKKQTTPWFEFTGLITTGHGLQIPIEVSYLDKASPITDGLKNWTTIKEELYNNVTGKLLDTAKPVARGKQLVKKKNGQEGFDETIVVWTNMYMGKTKVFGTTLGHNNATVADDRYLDLVARGLLWSVGKLDQAHLQPAKSVLLESTDSVKSK